jgi:hypothetical protein
MQVAVKKIMMYQPPFLSLRAVPPILMVVRFVDFTYISPR